MARKPAMALLIVAAAMANRSWAQGTEATEGALDLDLPPARSLRQFGQLLINLDEVVETVAFYTCLMSVLLILMGLTIALRQRAWSHYTWLAALGLIWIAFYDQNLSGIYWSGIEMSPRGLIVLGYAMASTSFIVAGLTIPAGHWQARLRWPLVVMALLCLASWPYGRALPADQATIVFNVTAIIGGLAHIIPLSTLTRLDGRPDRLLRRTAAMIAVIAVVVAGVVSAGLAGADVDIIFINRVLIAMIVGFLCVFFALRIKDLREDREAAVAQRLAAAERAAQISRDLLTAQQEHAETMEIARLQRMRLAEASHDIRQPIMSLRTTMAALTTRQPAEVQDQLRAAFDYLDGLAGSYMDEARSGAPITAVEDGLDDQGRHIETETVQTAMLLQTLDSMFREEAEARGLTLRVEGPDLAVRVAPLATMRILSNLISNAIKHAAPGDITVSVAHVGAEARITVANAGPLPEGDVFAAYEKGATSDGAGLGLAIVRELAQANGYTLTHQSGPAGNPKAGTEFCLTLPLADGSLG